MGEGTEKNVIILNLYVLSLSHSYGAIGLNFCSMLFPHIRSGPWANLVKLRASGEAFDSYKLRAREGTLFLAPNETLSVSLGKSSAKALR